MSGDKKLPPPKSALLCNIGALGDTVIRNTILDSVRKTFDHIGYICGPSTASILEEDDRVDRTYVFNNSVQGFCRLAKAILAQRHDLYLDLKDHDSTTGLLIATACRANLKVGCNRKRFRPFHRNTAEFHGTLRKKVDVMKDIAQLADLKPGEFRRKIHCSEESRKWLRTTHPDLGRFHFVNISATVSNRMWPVEHWIEFLSAPAMSNSTFLLSGLPVHRPNVERIVDQVDNCVAFRPRHIMDVVAAIEQADITLTVDTGVTQLAAGLDRPMIVLYASREQAHEFSPGGEGNIFLSPDTNKQIETLRPATVLEVSQGMMHAGT